MVVHVGSPEETQDQGKPTLELGVAPPDRPQTDRPQLDQVKGVFLASLNHEIRTPLSGIMGMLDLLLETSIDDDQRDYLNAARLCAESLSELLNSSLEYAALEAGQTGSFFESYHIFIAHIAFCILAYSGVESVLQTAGLVRSWREIGQRPLE